MSAFRQYNTTGVSHNMWGNEFCALSAFLLDDFVTLNWPTSVKLEFLV